MLSQERAQPRKARSSELGVESPWALHSQAEAGVEATGYDRPLTSAEELRIGKVTPAVTDQVARVVRVETQYPTPESLS